VSFNIPHQENGDNLSVDGPAANGGQFLNVLLKMYQWRIHVTGYKGSPDCPYRSIWLTTFFFLLFIKRIFIRESILLCQKLRRISDKNFVDNIIIHKIN
jgi:hypothetical protein